MRTQLIMLGVTAIDPQVDVKIRTRHVPPISQKRVISPYEPIVKELIPGFGRVNNGIAIDGLNFLPGKVTVLFDGAEPTRPVGQEFLDRLFQESPSQRFPGSPPSEDNLDLRRARQRA